MDHLQAIRMFGRVVETGSFTRAAQSLDQPNATVSKWVRQLELRLGVTLFERNTRNVTLTREGADYYARTQPLLSELDDVESTLKSGHSSPRGELRVDVGSALANGVLIPALADFHARYPEIRLRLSVSDRMVGVIQDNVDCALRGSGDDPDLIAVRLGDFAYTTCASPEWIRRHGPLTHPQEIAQRGLPVAAYYMGHSGDTRSLLFCRGDERVELRDFERPLLVNDAHAHLAAGMAGLGLLQTLDLVLRPAIEAGRLVPLLSDWTRPPTTLFAAYPPSRRHNTKVRVFIEWLASILPTGAPTRAPAVQALASAPRSRAPSRTRRPRA